VAARATGYAAEVTYPAATEAIHVQLTPDTPQSDRLFVAIAQRQNTRSEYDSQPIPIADLDTMQALPLEPGVVLHNLLEPAQIETVLDYVNQGNLHQYADPEFVAELVD